jgi:hypothetical protein
MGCRTLKTRHNRVGISSTYCAPRTPSILLRAVPSNLRDRPVYVYIVTTIKTISPDYELHQTGNAPNFAGGRITLCTCKHKDRATFWPSSDTNDPWKNVWVAGLTSKTEDPSRALAYLMYVEHSFQNQLDLWRALPNRCRQAKCASRSGIGDLYEPKSWAVNDPHDPSNYYRPPIGRHVHSSNDDPDKWHEDIQHWGKGSRSHRLLLGQNAHSYRWAGVKIILKLDAIGASAHHAMYDTLEEFVDDLQGFDP